MRPPHAECVHPDGHQHLGSLLLDACLQFRDRLAIVELDRHRQRARLSYDEIRREALRVARRFEQLGLAPGDRVAIAMASQPVCLVSAMATFLRGMVLVPLDPGLPLAEQAARIRHARPRALITEAGHWSRLEHELPDGLVAIVSEWMGPAPERDPEHAPEHGVGFARWEDVADEVPATRVERARDDVACIVYASSGDGGRPKGCMLTHGACLAQLAALIELHPLRPDERCLSLLPMIHGTGFIAPFASGAAVVHQLVARPEVVLETLKTQGITRMTVDPHLLEALERALDARLAAARPWQQRAIGVLARLNAALTQKAPRQALSRALIKPVHDGLGGHLELVFTAGAEIDERRARRFYELGIPIVIGYGPTECTAMATLQDLAPFRADSVGRAVPGVEIRIHEPDADGRGEVWIRGATVMKGYLDDPELTAATLVRDPAGDGDGKGPWLRTGDIGRLDAARHLHLLGRREGVIAMSGRDATERSSTP